MKRYLFVCSQNRLRGPTAERIFAGIADIEIAAPGTHHDAETPLTAEWIDWADPDFVMERTHRSKIRARFRRPLNGTPILCIPTIVPSWTPI